MEPKDKKVQKVIPREMLAGLSKNEMIQLSYDLEDYCQTVLFKRETISEDDFRRDWLQIFFYEKEPNLSLWIRQVAGNAMKAVDILNKEGKVVCTVPPIFAPKNTTIVKGDNPVANLSSVLTICNARANQMPTKRQEIIAATMQPYVDRAESHTDEWVKEWIKLTEYFKIPRKDWLAADPLSPEDEAKENLVLVREDEDDETYQDFENL